MGGGGTKLGGKIWFFINGGGGLSIVGGLGGCLGSILNENCKKNCLVSLFQWVQNFVSDLSTSLLGTWKKFNNNFDQKTSFFCKLSSYYNHLITIEMVIICCKASNSNWVWKISWTKFKIKNNLINNLYKFLTKKQNYFKRNCLIRLSCKQQILPFPVRRFNSLFVSRHKSVAW